MNFFLKKDQPFTKLSFVLWRSSISAKINDGTNKATCTLNKKMQINESKNMQPK